MTDFVKITDYAAKDALLTGNPAKLVKGVEIGADFDAVAVAVATKHDAADIGVTVQAYSANLDEYAAVNPTAAGLAILDDATASDQLTTLGGTVVGKAVFTAATASDQLTTLGVSAFAKTILDDADEATFKATVNLEPGIDVLAYVAPGTSGNILTSNGAAWTSATPTTTTSTEQGLTQFYYPANGSAYQDLYRSGWLPSWFNQQWGGSQWGTLPDGSFGSVATGSIEDNGAQDISGFAAAYYRSAGFKVSDSATFDAIWVKLYKVGNPTYNLTARIYSDSAGSPNAAIGSAATVSAKTFTSKTDGEWVQFTGLNCALTAGTQYHIVLSSLAAVDATNYVQWKYTNSKKYPHGNLAAATSTPVWTPNTTSCPCFLIQNPAANSLIQSGGQFDYKLAFNPGSPVDQSRSIVQPLVNFYDGKNCTVLYRGSFAANTGVWEFVYGLDHDKISLTINSSGYPTLIIFRSDGTSYTVTGTGSVTSGFHDVGLRVRTVGDGSDYATLYVDGVSVGTPLTGQTFSMDVNMKLLGTARLGDCFNGGSGIPAWAVSTAMTALPSSGAVWAWSGTGTEASCMSIQNNKLYQNANGYTSTQSGYYTKTTALNNTNGWTVCWKSRVASSLNTSGSYDAYVDVQDGAKRITVMMQEYFVQVGIPSVSTDFTVQGDFKSQEHVFILTGKGSDYYLWMDGRLAIDGTGKLTTASATNSITFGDANTTASENADVIWSYVKYMQNAQMQPIAGANTCSEFAHWSGDKSALLPSLYNSGSPVSVKQICGVPRNYQFEQVVQREVRRGVTAAPTTTATSAGVMTDMEAYVIGSDIRQFHESVVINSTTGSTVVLQQSLDGVNDVGSTAINATASGAVYQNSANSVSAKSIPLGLHKSEGRWYVSANTGTASNVQRQFTVEGRS